MKLKTGRTCCYDCPCRRSRYPALLVPLGSILNSLCSSLLLESDFVWRRQSRRRYAMHLFATFWALERPASYRCLILLR